MAGKEENTANKESSKKMREADDDSVSQPESQDLRERLEIRRGYRDLLDNLQKNKEEHINPQSESLLGVLQEANKLNAKVKAPREGAMDSAAILMISNFGKQKIESLKTDFIKFEPVEFAEKLKTRVRGAATQEERDVPITSEEWMKLGRGIQKFFRKSPAFHFMSGAFEPGERIKVKDKKNKNAVKENQNEKATVVNKMSKFEENGKNEATTVEVERVLDILKRCYTESEDNPVCYFEFVLNPRSFGQTVENIFYASFLVRDGLAKISLDDDNLPVIEPIEAPENDQRATNKKEKNQQTVIAITPQEWKELVQVYRISNPLIPTRRVDPTEPIGKKVKKS